MTVPNSGMILKGIRIVEVPNFVITLGDLFDIPCSTLD